MDTNLMPACDIIGCNEKILKDIDYYELEKIIKEVQRNAIEVAVQRCNKEAVADYVVLDDNVEKIHDETIECGIIPIEAYVTTSSILDCKQKLFEENNLI